MILQKALLGEQIENALKEEIVKGRFAPGEKISVEELAAEWGVSNTPIRDAMRRLEKAGILKVVPRRGVYVATLDQADFKHVFDLRIALECLAIRTATLLIPDAEVQSVFDTYEEAARRLQKNGDRKFLIDNDPAIHTVIVQYCGNPKLIEYMQDLHYLIIWVQGIMNARQRDSFERALPEHLVIVRAMKSRDAQAAEAALRTHLENVYLRAQEQWNSNQSKE